jgi:transcriptional regulator with XRE-family HTH domain
MATKKKASTTTTTTSSTTAATATKLGQKLRSLRRREGLTQQALAERLGVSPAYLNLIENGRRPLPASMLIALAQLYSLDLAAFAVDDDAQLTSELFEVFGDPLFDNAELLQNDIKELANQQPNVARAVLALYRAYEGKKFTVDDDASPVVPAPIPSEDVSDFLQRHGNYFADLEGLAEGLRKSIGIDDAKVSARGGDDLGRHLVRFLEDKLGVAVEVARASADPHTLRRFDVHEKRLVVSELLPPRSRNFQLAHQLGLLIGKDIIDALTRDELLTTDEAKKLARVALANAFAGAVLMPYLPFLEAAEASRYDIELLGHRFRTSFEQGCHRVTTLRRRVPPLERVLGVSDARHDQDAGLRVPRWFGVFLYLEHHQKNQSRVYTATCALRRGAWLRCQVCEEIDLR